MVQAKVEQTFEHKNSSFHHPLIQITRLLRAPVEDIWKAWTSADLIKQWWGPWDFTCPSARILFRENGKYLFAMKSPQKKLTWSTGRYERIIPYEKIVFSDQFCDESGHVIFDEKWPEKCFVTAEFENCNKGHTKLVVTHEGVPKSMHDDYSAGWMSSIDKLKNLVEKN